MKYRLFISLIIALFTSNCSADSVVPSEAGKDNAIANPIPFSMKSISRGKQLYTSYCIDCHGGDGRADTGFREFLKTPPADLADDQWIYGSEDVAIFDVIKNGRQERDMPAFGATADDTRIWYIVNYLKYLQGERP